MVLSMIFGIVIKKKDNWIKKVVRSIAIIIEKN